MGRVILHLLGSVVLGLVLLVVAELPRATEARASEGARRSASTSEQCATVPAHRQTLLERCRQLIGLPEYVAPARRTEVPFVLVRSTSFGWNYLPDRPLPW